jgi:hypothetical protein
MRPSYTFLAMRPVLASERKMHYHSSSIDNNMSFELARPIHGKRMLVVSFEREHVRDITSAKCQEVD